MQPSNPTDKPSTPSALPQASTKSAVSLSDAEVICSFMDSLRRDGAWWSAELPTGSRGPVRFVPITLELNALHEAEELLTDEQWGEYCAGLRKDLYHPLWGMKYPGGMDRPMLHATAEQKIRALAAVLRIG